MGQGVCTTEFIEMRFAIISLSVFSFCRNMVTMSIIIECCHLHRIQFFHFVGSNPIRYAVHVVRDTENGINMFPAVGVPSLVRPPEGNLFVFSFWPPLLALHIPTNSTFAFRCLWWKPCHNKRIFLSLAYLRYLWVQHSFCCTSSQVITSKLSTTFVNLFHDIAFLKSGSKKVNSCNLSSTLVNSIHDMAKK